MFTGIIEEFGVVEKLERRQNLFVLTISAKKVRKGLKLGDSVAVNGVCLTVTNLGKNSIVFDIMRETILRTALGYLKHGDKVNLERALKMGDRFSGHIVTGHVDNVAKVQDRVEKKNFTELRFKMPAGFAPFVVEKGSICIDGVSLTVGKVKAEQFSVHLIPFTKKVTTLGFKNKGDLVNLEIDILAKYILKK